MADERVSSACVQNIICAETGLEKEDLIVGYLREIDETLAKALTESKRLRDPNIFIGEWGKHLTRTQISEYIANKDKFKEEEVKEIMDNILNVSSKFIGEADEECGSICNGFITTGTYQGVPYSYYTKRQQEGLEALAVFILTSLGNTDEDNADFDAYLNNTLGGVTNNVYSFEKRRGQQEQVVKGGKL